VSSGAGSSTSHRDAARHAPTLDDALIARAASLRSGLVLPCQALPSTACEIDGYFHASVGADPAYPWQTTSGGVAHSPAVAASVAAAEALERYAAAVCNFEVRPLAQVPPEEAILPLDEFAQFSPAQQAQAGYPWPRVHSGLMGRAYALDDDTPAWVPQEMLGLGPKQGEAFLASVSTGLAAQTNAVSALWSGLFEVLERDALAVTWLNALVPPELEPPAEAQQQVQARHGKLRAFDLTQSWNPFPVIAVAGTMPRNGRLRHAFGVACRATAAQAFDKAWREWMQGIVFADYLAERHPPLEVPTTFEQHAVYYSQHPEQWDKVPLWATHRPAKALSTLAPHPSLGLQDLPAGTRLRRAAGWLRERGVRLYYRDLTTCDVAQAGLHVVRVLSPDMSQIHGDDRWPYLGGRVRDVDWRYAGVPRAAQPFPNPFPHPLG
jgi:ribosomal protein S12 methylthiotransferase accessory factor